MSSHNGTAVPLHESVGMRLDEQRRTAVNYFNELVYRGDIRIETVDSCFCGERRFQLLSRFDRFGLPFGTQICRDCGLISQTRRIAPGSMPLFYAEVYWPLVTGSTRYSTPPKLDEAESYVLRHVPPSERPVLVFEVGCGSGGRLLQLKKELEARGQAARILGCDYSDEALKLAVAAGADVVAGGMESLEPAGKADVLILSHVFEHLPDLQVALDGIEKLTHQESLIYVEVPGVVDLENKREYDYNYQTYSVLAHTYNFSLDTLAGVFATRRFRLVEGEEYVRAVFKKGEVGPSPGSSYDVIMKALDRAHRKQRQLEAYRNHPARSYLKNVAKALLGRS